MVKALMYDTHAASQHHRRLAGSAEPGADKASLLAKTVYEGVKQRMHQLQADVQACNQQIASLQAGLEAAALHRDAALKQAQAEQQVQDLCNYHVYAKAQWLV